MIELSIFDVDRTITRKPTYSLFLLFAMRRRAPWRVVFTPLLGPVALAYAAGLITRTRMKEFMHWVALGGSVRDEDARALAEEFAAELHRDGLYPQAIERMEAERQAGRTVVLATAAPSLYIAPLAKHLAIADVVATGAIRRGDVLTHRIAGTNCYGKHKLTMIVDALAEKKIAREAAHVRFFTDHSSDSAVCEWADEAFAVNPSPKMEALARQKGWPVIDWRTT
ncbi:MAG: HAD-IB family hydrolase [Porphyrobacter sp.]|nr:HAD-IB family hydrolase [Porphyrobacter sp.]